jgi:ArsR family transcriptional regulator, zinc-responsive transcriptional repressor
MEDISATLVNQLLDKALENMKPEDRLAFVEKLFAELPSAAQQEFLIKLTRVLIEAGTQPNELQKVLEVEPCKPVVVRLVQADLADFTPGQMCCQALNSFTSSPDTDEKQVMVIAQMFNGLADETRLKIVKLLSKGEFTVEDLVEFLGIAQSTTSHHLHVLKEAHMIQGEKRGRNIYYSLVQPEKNE